jgi:hypothetical protein
MEEGAAIFRVVSNIDRPAVDIFWVPIFVFGTRDGGIVCASVCLDAKVLVCDSFGCRRLGCTNLDTKVLARDSLGSCRILGCSNPLH